MTDIAILVIEEFERNVRKDDVVLGSEVGNRELGMVSCVSMLAQSLKKKIGQEHVEFVKWVNSKELKTQFALAASNGFFSA